MLSLIPDVQAEDVDRGKVASQLDCIRIVSCEKPELIAKLKKETSFITSKNGYEELMDINEEGEKTTIYLKQNKNGTNEFILVNRQKEDFNLIFIIGKLTLQEVQGIVN